ncbi:MAG TPA: hypothetical protein PK263_04440 [bacterium]|nr:hypothetical protein [bacterium]
MPEEETIELSSKPKKRKSWPWILIILVILAVIGAGAWYYTDAKNKTADEEATEETVETTEETSDNLEDIPTVVDETADWKTYTNTTYGFSFKYPSDYVLHVDMSGEYDESKTNLFVDTQDVTKAGGADGACGSSSSSLYQSQKGSFEKTSLNDNFDNAFKMTNVGTENSKVSSNTNGVKFALGFDNCRGLVQDSDSTSYFLFGALTFSGNTRVHLWSVLSKAQSDNVKYSQLSSKTKQIADGSYSGQALGKYNDFKKLIDTFQFIKQSEDSSLHSE